ncbi:MAG: hypothetical protein GX793_10260 [Bacteroidales bacterium]|jgi:hypothetical protein|nr:hypothetical protein [Bacteroidales bacterium]
MVFATVFSCRNPNNDKPEIITEKKTIQEKLDLQILDSLPIPVGTCTTCFFAKNEEDFNKRHYIWIDNSTGLGYMKINDKLVEFEINDGFADDESRSWSSKNNKYELEMTKDEIANNGEFIGGAYIPSQIFKGSIKIKSNGDFHYFDIYGECGCLK